MFANYTFIDYYKIKINWMFNKALMIAKDNLPKYEFNVGITHINQI